MTIEETIKKAIEGGWMAGWRGIPPLIKGDFVIISDLDKFLALCKTEPRAKFVLGTFEKIVLQKNFWECLGKAMGWEDKIMTTEMYAFRINPATPPCWGYYWHKFIDHLIIGGTIEGFFKEL